MNYITFSLLMIVVGVIGILKNKFPKYRDGVGFSISLNYYLMFYGLVILGVLFLILEILE